MGRLANCDRAIGRSDLRIALPNSHQRIAHGLHRNAASLGRIALAQAINKHQARGIGRCASRVASTAGELCGGHCVA